jgi:hypothetical protein
MVLLFKIDLMHWKYNEKQRRATTKKLNAAIDREEKLCGAACSVTPTNKLTVNNNNNNNNNRTKIIVVPLL